MAEATWTSEELYLLADRGYGFYQQGRYEEAAVIFDGLIALDAGNSYYRTALAAICLALGDAQRAVDASSAVLEQTPADLDAGGGCSRAASAALFLARGAPQRAVDELSAVLEMTPADLEARARRCEAYCELRRWAEARRDLAVLQRNGERNHARRLAWRLQTQSGSA